MLDDFRESLENWLIGYSEEGLPPDGSVFSAKEFRAKIDDFLKQKEFQAAAKRSGLYSAGFLFASEALRERFVFLPRTGEQQERLLYTVPYAWDDPANEQYSILLQESFFLVRRQQQALSKSGHIRREEFYRYLNLPEKGAAPSVAGSREGKPVGAVSQFSGHYCSVGEMFFWLYAWRRAVWQTQICQVTTDSELDVTLPDLWKWGDQSLPLQGWKTDIQNVWERWLEKFGLRTGKLTWQKELELLGLIDAVGQLSDRARALAIFLAQPLHENNAVQNFDREIADKVAERTSKSQRTADCLRRWVEDNAPIPILPFYFWNVTNSSPVTYFVTPTWKSVRFPVRYQPANCEDSTYITGVVGLALCATAPCEHDGTWPRGNEPLGRPQVRDLSSFLAFLAQPLVELNFYEILYEEVQHRRKREIQAAIMSRNLSHNIGSHALANPRLFESLGFDSDEKFKEQKARLTTFHQYTQGRLDFIARTLGDTEDRPGPLFFIRDVLAGFIRQTVLLDTLVQDLGFRRDQIEFLVSIRPRLTGRRRWRTLKCSDRQRQNEEVRHESGLGLGAQDLSSNQVNTLSEEEDDVLVGIPAGTIGCHALFAFLENCMRNAAKYGQSKSTDKNQKFRIKLELEDYHIVQVDGRNEDCWILTIWDDISSDGNGLIADSIRTYINKSYIDDRGEPRQKGHGTQEMKICADFLAGDLRFPADQDELSKDGTDYAVYVLNLRDRQNRQSERDVNAQRGGESVSLENTALRCFDLTEDGKQWLAYQLLLPQPQLLGVIGSDRMISDDQHVLRPSAAPTVCFYRSFSDEPLKLLAESGAHIGVILDRPLETVWTHLIIAGLVKYHHALPFRLLILTTSAQRYDHWKVALNDYAPDEGKTFTLAKHIPNRRVKVILLTDGDVELFNFLAEQETRTPYQDNHLTFRGSTHWDGCILRLYDLWISNYKIPPRDGPWNLCIGFKRQMQQVKSRWQRPLTVFLKNDAGLKPLCNLAVYVCAENEILGIESQSQASYNRIAKLTQAYNHEKGAFNDEGLLNEDNSYIVFDDHGKSISGLKGGESFNFAPRFYQEMGLQSFGLYQELESPPGSSFGFAFFLYSLLESALTNIAILDERVSEATLTAEGPCRKPAMLLQWARIFPLLSYKRKEKTNFSITKEQAFVSRNVENATLQTQRANWEMEGLNINEDRASVAAAFLNPAGNIDIRSLNNVDVLIIHEGITDVLERKKLWQYELVDQIYHVAPMVIRCSGRGPSSQTLGDWLPFLEFSELGENTYHSLNKLALSRAVLSLRGQPRKL